MTATALFALMTAITFQPATTTVCELGRIDRANTTSWSCLSCHDGSSAPSVSLHSGGPGSHPVGVSYRFGRPTLSLRPFGPASALVVLPAGRVECTTCHAAGGAGPSSTVTRELCTDCHEK